MKNDGRWWALGAALGVAAAGVMRGRRGGSRSQTGELALWFPWYSSNFEAGYPPVGSYLARGALYLASDRRKTRVNVEHGTLVDPRVHVGLQHLVQTHPELAQARLSVDNTPDDLTVEAALDAGWRDPVTSRLPTLYHGTSTALLPGIERAGLAPRGETGIVPTHAGVGQTRPSQADRVYLTTYDAMGPARFASVDAVKKHGGARVVLEIDPRGLERDRLAPDEDADVHAYVRYDALPMAEWPEWARSLARMGTVAYRGRIAPRFVRVWRTLS